MLVGREMVPLSATADMFNDNPAAQLTIAEALCREMAPLPATENMFNDDPAAQLTIASICLWLI